MATNLQTFSGEVEIPEGNLQLKRILELSTNNASTSNTGILFSRNLGSTSNSNVIVYFDEATDSLRFGHTMNASSDSEITMDTANVLNMNVFGDIEASFFKGDGGLLSNLVTDLQSVTENGADTDQTLILTNAVTGIDVQTGNVNVAGNVTASIFFGDGGLLSNITQTLQGITEIGNTTSIALEFNNVTTGFVTTSNVGIVNTAPQHNFSVGSNLYVHDTASNVLTVEGNVSAHRLTLGAIEITPAYGLENVTNISNLAYDTLLFQNASTAFVTTAMAGIGLQPDSSDVGTSGLHVDGHLRLGGQADNTDNELMYIKSAGALGVLANESDTNNTNTDLRLQSGETYNSNITMVGKNSAQYMTFGTNTAERMRIDSSGRVGIGTTNPSYQLDVHGSTAYDGSTTLRILNPASQYGRTQLHIVGRYENSNDAFSADGARNAIMFKSQSSVGSAITNQWTIQSFPNGTNNDLGFMAGTVDTPKVVFRGTNGNVGIGTTNPSSNLHVNGNVYVSSNLEVGTANLFVDTQTGNVGIGTTNPLSLLTIKTNYSGGESSGLCLDSYDGSVYNFRLYSFIQSANNVGWKFRVNNGASSVDALTLGSTGNVGIGTTNPSYNLDVNGTCYVRNTFMASKFHTLPSSDTIARYVVRHATTVNVSSLSLNIRLNSIERGGFLRVYGVGGLSGGSSGLQYPQFALIFFNWGGGTTLNTDYAEQYEADISSSISLSIISNGTMTITRTNPGTTSYISLYVEAFYEGGIYTV